MAIAEVLRSAHQTFAQYPFSSTFLSLPLTLLLYILINEFIRRQYRIPGLSGPSGLPIIGNIADIRANAAEKYRQWSKVHGAVFQIQLGNVPIVVINSAEAARSIFGANAQALSSRPEFYTFHKVSVYCRSRSQSGFQVDVYSGSVKHSWHNNWHISLLRLPETPP